MDAILQFASLILCVLGASFFAGAETGFVSWNPLKVSYRAASGDIVARWALFLIRHKDRLLSAVLIGNNICVIGASLAFSSFFEAVDNAVAPDLTRIPSPESWILTPIIVLFGEMLPKSLFRLYPFRLTMRAVPFLTGLYFATLPFTFIFSLVTSMFRNIRKRGESFMTKVREEMVLVAMEGSKSGTLFRHADIFLQNALMLNERKLRDLCESSGVVMQSPGAFRFRADQTVAAAKKQIGDQQGIIVHEVSGDRIRGLVSLIDLANASDDAVLGTMCKPLPRMPAEWSLLTALRYIEQRASSFFGINDEKGELIGVVDHYFLIHGIFSGPEAIPSHR